MSRFLILVLVVSILVSCDQKPDIHKIPPAPSELISEEKFTQLMVDVELLEASLKLKLLRKKDIKNRILTYYDQIFEKHKVTETQFRESLDFYSLQASRIAVIYDSVEVRLTRLKIDLEAAPDSTNVLESLKKTQ